MIRVGADPYGDTRDYGAVSEAVGKARVGRGHRVQVQVVPAKPNATLQ